MAQKYRTPDAYVGQTFKNPYPTESSLDPFLKRQKDYFLAFNNAFFCDYASNYCYVPFEFGAKRSFQELRAYATGQQSANKIKENLIGAKKKNRDGKFITKMNVSFDTYYKLPQMFDVMREKNMSQEYDISVSCIDDDSIAAKEADKDMLLYLIDENNKNFMRQVGFIPNTPINPEEMGLRTAQDVKTYFEIGGYTMHREIACQAACQKSKLTSNYKVIQDQTFDDLIVAGLCGWKTYIEASTKLPKFRKVNIDRALIPYSEMNDFSDITRAGEIRIMSIADIRKENPDLKGSELLYLAKCFAWMNPQYTATINSNYYKYQSPYDGTNITNADVDPVSRVKIMVLDSQWLSVDVETNLKNVTGNGHNRFKEIPFDYEVDKKSAKSGDKKIQKNVIRKYYSSWIIGTDMFLDYGVCKDVVYYGVDGNKTPKLDFFFAKTGNASLVERAVAIVDDIDMAIVKQRNALATIPAAPGLAIQKDLLENVFLNGILQQPDDILQGLQERGVMYYNALDDHGKPLYMSGGQKPIEYLDVTKIAGILAVYGNHIAEKVNELREVLGMQNGADAGGTSAYQGLGQTKLAFQAANASLYPTFNAYNYVFKAAFEDIIKKWQIVAKDGEVKINYSLLGSKNMQVFKLDKNFDNYDFNLEIEIAPSQEEKQNLLQTIVQQKALGDQTGGAQGLTMSEYLYVYRKVMAGNVDEAMYLMAQIEAKKKQEQEASKQADIQANAQVQQQSAETKGQLDQQLLAAKAEADKQQALLTALLKQNEMLINQIVSPQKPEEISKDDLAIPIVALNNAQIEAIVAPQPTQEELMAQQQPPQEIMA